MGLAALLLALLVTAIAPSLAEASFPQLLRFCQQGEGGGECSIPRGVEVNPETGHLYVVDQRNSRIQEFTAWGGFVKAWGWGVVASGPGDEPRNEIQELTVDATGGTFKLRYGIPGGFTDFETAQLPFNASAGEVEDALVDAPFNSSDIFEPGDLEVSGPDGGPWAIEFVGRYEDSDFGGSTRRLEGLDEGLSDDASSIALRTIQDGANYEVCRPADGDVCRAGLPGHSAGQMGATTSPDRGPLGIALDSAGDVYVLDWANHRIQKYDPEGNFLLAFGGDVVAHGPGDSSNDETQQVKIAAADGSFSLGFESPFAAGGTDQTAPIAHDASAAEVEVALKALETIGGVGGSVSVSGGPGDATGSAPYLVTFEGDLGGDQVPELTVRTTGLAQPVGSQLQCSTTTTASTIQYRWHRNGVQIPAAAQPTYTTTAADEGAAIQCQVTTLNANAGSTQFAGPAQMIAPFPATAPPQAPDSIPIPEQSAPITVGGPGGQTLTCDPSEGSWRGSPTFSYRWYRNGAQISGATEATYVVSAADLATAAAFQCAVTGSNAGGAVTRASANLTTSPAPSPAAPNANASLAPSVPSTVTTANEGGAPEVCDGDEGDVCKAGAFGTPGPGEGEFGSWTKGGLPEQGGIPFDGDYLDIGPDDTIHVGDTGRIQKFAPDGSFEEQIEGPALAGETMQSLAVDEAGDLYAVFASESSSGNVSKSDVRRLNPSGGQVGLIEVPNPRGLVLDAAGNLYAINREGASSEILGFGPSGMPIDLEPNGPGLGIGAGALTTSTGIAASSPPTCGLEGTNLVVANSDNSNSFINLYGSAPDPDVCPPPAQSPTIAAQFATAVDTTSATLKARINPHFWSDTRYFVQYGTGKCSEGGCAKEQPAAPGALLTDQVIDAELETKAVFLTGLQPGTTYHYRFVAESSGGEATVGEERSLRTLLPGSSESGCPNDSFRVGPSAKLPDCRAYELVSPLDKENGDIAKVSLGYAQAAASGQRVTFNSQRAFADPKGAPLINQYLATRGAGGWATESISPPRTVPSLYAPTEVLTSPFRGFSADLCSGWVIGDTDLGLTPDAPAGVPNLYRRENCGGGGYELLTSSLPPGFGPVPYETYYFPTIQGFSEDSEVSVFRANAALAVTDGPRAPFVCTTPEGAEGISYQWLRDGVPIEGATQSTYTAAAADAGATVQCELTTSDPQGASIATSEALPVEPFGGTHPPNPGTHTPARPKLPGAPTVTGTPRAGKTLTCTPGEWKGEPAFSYQWHRDGVPIEGATESTYVPASTDAGKSVQCQAIGSNAGGSAVADSESVAIEASPPLTGSGPSVSGTPEAGQTLSCDPGSWSGSPSFSYQWLRNNANIGGATTPEYTLTATDEGKAIQCRVAASNSDGAVLAASERLVVSPPPGTAPPSLEAPPAVSGEAEVEATLSCDPGTWAGSPTFAYRWYRDGTPIAPIGISNKQQYTLSENDLGHAIQCLVSASNAGGSVVAVNASQDGVAYPQQQPPPSAPEAIVQGNFQLYLSDADGELRLVSVQPDGSVATNGATSGTGWTTGAASAGTRYDGVQSAVSAEGSRVFWTETSSFGGGTTPGNPNGPGRLLLRLNATEPQSAMAGGQCTEAGKGCTIVVSGSSQSSFVAADPQASRVIYRVGETLFEAEIAQEGGQWVADSTQIAVGVKGVMGASEDTERVYLVSTEVLSGEEENSEGGVAQSGGRNLYLYEHGAGFTFVANLAPRDTTRSSFGGASGPSTVALSPYYRSSRVTPDGLAAAFTSTASLTGYDNADAATGDPDAEVFVYRAEGELLCASCDPSGARPAGRLIHTGISGPDDDIRAAAIIPGWNLQFQPSRALSDNGNRLFFNSYDALLPGDSNGKADVYEWEAPGAGSCSASSASFSEANGGCLALITSGTSGEDSEFLDATPSGLDVFFTTQSSLVPQDYGLRDVYNARVNGGFPAPALREPDCEGEACQGQASAPQTPTPASATFQGIGNAAPGAASAGRCNRAARKAKRHARRAKRLRRAARRAKAPAKARRMRRAAKRRGLRARALSKSAKRCRRRARAPRGAGR